MTSPRSATEIRSSRRGACSVKRAPPSTSQARIVGSRSLSSGRTAYVESWREGLQELGHRDRSVHPAMERVQEDLVLRVERAEDRGVCRPSVTLPAAESRGNPVMA